MNEGKRQIPERDLLCEIHISMVWRNLKVELWKPMSMLCCVQSIADSVGGNAFQVTGVT